MNNYREYFDIDPEYFPQVDKKIIDTQPDYWKKFYPHPSFVTLLKSTVDVLKRKQKLSIWVDGAYGTGKSHAVLTLKKILEASEAETNEYFQKYKLDNFLCKDLMAEKNSGKILVCHRYGSSDITSDTDLIIAIQEGIEKALHDNGIENNANESLKQALIRYFENEENKQSFDIYASGTYKAMLGGDKAEDILIKLKQFEDDSLRALIGKVFKVQSVRGAFSMNTSELCDWIREVIEKNNLKELIFIWDEFSEYFENNMHHLTGFQQIAELSATAPFCLMIVTHKSEGYFSDGDPDKRKILDRFVTPIVHISLPENIAFELMAQAMKITSDTQLAEKWERNKSSLGVRTQGSRNVVKNNIHLTEKDLLNVLPIHPYAALLLQHISIYFTSTARSMFNFIKNDEGDNVKAFQWFIDHYGFTSQNPYVTVDMLWSFFYENGQDKLASSFKDVLSFYTPKIDKSLIEEEKKVLKAILLLQAVSERMVGNRDVFLPNEKNLSLVFEGTDLELQAPKIARKLLNDHVITRTPLTGDVFSYCCKKIGPAIDPTPYFDTAKSRSTKDLTFTADTGLRNLVELTGALKLRYALSYATTSDLDLEIKKANNPSGVENKIYAVIAIGKDSKEQVTLKKKIETFFGGNPDSNVVIIDAAGTLGDDEYQAYIENYAMSLAIGQSDLTQRKTYEGYATDVLKAWAKNIKNGNFYVYSRHKTKGEKVSNVVELVQKLMEEDKYQYPKCFESEFTRVIQTMYDSNSLQAGALCGINEETKGTYKASTETAKLENALAGAWKVPNYWENSFSYIAILKREVETLINEEFRKSNRIAISVIYNFLKTSDYGMMPCNLSAFILGFLLKEYANGVYSYSDNMTTEPLTAEKLAQMISDIIKQENIADKRYKDKYIVTLTVEERSFNKATSEIFGIEEKYCVSVTETRAKIREKMKTYSFPVWLAEFTLLSENLKTNKDLVSHIIDLYCGIANNKNLDGKKTDTDIALEIGKLCLENPSVISDLKSVISRDNCRNGMLEYLNQYREGELPSLANAIGDGGQFINYLQYKFDADAANWVWNRATVNQKIDELIVEYKTVESSNRILTKCTTYRDTMSAWVSKISQVKIAYSAIKDELGDEKDLLEMLSKLKKQGGTFVESQKAPFLDEINKHAESFRNFLSDQSTVFMKAFAFYLDDLTIEDVRRILDNDSYGFNGTINEDLNIYIKKVQTVVADYKNSQGWSKLKNRWEEMTGTLSPKDWSNQNKMPILSMVPADEMSVARVAFDVLNEKKNDEIALSKAEDYISKMKYTSDLNDHVAKEAAFRRQILGDYAVLYDSVDEIKDYLFSHMAEDPYHWAENSQELNNRVKQYSKNIYANRGYNIVKEIVDEMSAEKVKEYLKQLIQENVLVGVEIMKDKNK